MPFKVAVDTPTLLGITHTAPYFHDGRMDTLGEVTEYFDGQYNLRLSQKEKDDLTTYLKTVGDGVDAYEDTIYTLDAEMEEFTFFISSYEYLKQINKPDVINLLFETVKDEIRAHKWDVQDQGYLPVLNELEALMEDALKSNMAGDRDKVDAIVDEYRMKYKENVDHLK